MPYLDRHGLNLRGQVKQHSDNWYWHIFYKSDVIHWGCYSTEDEAIADLAQWFAENDDKLYLVAHGILKRRAMKQTRQRDYARAAECWKRHEAKLKAIEVATLQRSIEHAYQNESIQTAYQAMPLKDRTRYEKLLCVDHPLTSDEWQFATSFLLRVNETAGKS